MILGFSRRGHMEITTRKFEQEWVLDNYCHSLSFLKCSFTLLLFMEVSAEMPCAKSHFWQSLSDGDGREGKEKTPLLEANHASFRKYIIFHTQY